MKRYALMSIQLLLAFGLFTLLGIGLAMTPVTISSVGIIRDATTYVVVIASDGSGDYTTIQDGLNALPTSGGEVHVKDGDYLISHSIDIPDVDHVKLKALGTNVRIYTTTPNINIIHVQTSNVEISGFHIVGEGTHQTWDGGNGILLDGVENCTVKDVKVENMGTVGIYLRNSDNNTIENSEVRGSQKQGISLTSSSYNKVINTTSYENVHANFIVYTYKGISSHHNLFLQCDSYSSGDNGFYIDVGSDYNTIKDSLAYNQSAPWNGGGQGILVKADYALIENNEVWGSARSGIVFHEGASYGNITRNYAHDNYLSGIALVEGDNHTVTWNWCENSENRDGIEIESASWYNMLEYNTMINNARHDFDASGSYNNATNNYYETLYDGGTGNNIDPSLSEPLMEHP